MAILPFNHNPDSITVRTGSYTIPADQYARVTVLEAGDQDFTINGTTALKAKSIDVKYSQNSSGTHTVYTCPTGYTAEVTVWLLCNSELPDSHIGIVGSSDRGRLRERAREGSCGRRLRSFSAARARRLRINFNDL